MWLALLWRWYKCIQKWKNLLGDIQSYWITSRYLFKSLWRWRNSAFSSHFTWIYCFLTRSLCFFTICNTHKQRSARANTSAELSRAEPSRMELNWAERNQFALSSIQQISSTIIVLTGFPGVHHLANIRQEQLSWSSLNQSMRSQLISIRVHFDVILPPFQIVIVLKFLHALHTLSQQEVRYIFSQIRKNHEGLKLIDKSHTSLCWWYGFVGESNM
jgi:hypothetical protein